MNHELARKVADAVLYEGYMLYPYRPSAIKNRQRWTFGILYPPSYDEVRSGTERSVMQSECLLESKDSLRVHIQLRFLHLLGRQVEQFIADRFEPVSSLVVCGRSIETWDEGIAREVEFELALTAGSPQVVEFSFPASHDSEVLRNETGQISGRINRTQHELAGSISVFADEVREGVLKLSIDVANKTSLPGNALDRNSALFGSLLSAHTVLSAKGGEFVSLLDPPEDLRGTVARCQNNGNFPVLVGENGCRDMLLCSPILLYDYPQVALESAGDFYDATEMDEMLTLRVMTLSEQEKDEMRAADDHVRKLLQRTEQSAREQLRKTHGAIRSLRAVSEDR